MIPFDFFYKVFQDQLLTNANVKSICPALTNDRLDFELRKCNDITNNDVVIFYDQEPIDLRVFYSRVYRSSRLQLANKKILISSEYSTEQDLLCRDYSLIPCHYFYHALLCHEWYRNYWYTVQNNVNFDRVYITYNNLIINKRLYRANLIAELHQAGILEQGYVSYNNAQMDRLAESLDTYTLLPPEHKKNIESNLDLLNQKLIIDTDAAHGGLSAEIDIATMQSAFVNLVTETIFYEDKVHLTEKIFKPIVARTPFLLLAGPGNLAYLRSYGFKTFGDYWDESYDSMTNNVDRFNAVMSILKKLCNTPHHELVAMKRDMQHILDHNFNTFFKTMRPVVVDELTRNLGAALNQAEIKYSPNDLHALSNVLTY
jgi:hypothetical protein